DQGQRVFLLSGKVAIEQGTLQGKMGQAVVWIDEAGQKQTGIYRIRLYAEGDVSLVERTGRITGETPVPSALFELATRSEIKLKSCGSQIVQTPLPQEPLYQRALREVQGRVEAPQPNPIRQVSAQQEPVQGQPVQGFPPPPRPVDPFPPGAPPMPGA